MKAMSITLVMTIVLFALALPVLAEIAVEEWSVKTDSGNYHEEAFDIALDTAGNVYVTGFGYTGSNKNFLTIKYDENGNEDWASQYDGLTSGSDESKVMALDDAGNVYVSGTSYNTGTKYDYATVKYDASGGQSWVMRYDNAQHEDEYPKGIGVDGSGNVYVTGYSEGSGTDDDFATIKYDSNGTEQWVKRFNGTSNGTDRPAALHVYASGGVVVSGTSDWHFFTIRYDANGDVVWSDDFEEQGANTVYDMVVDDSGNVIITGDAVRSGTYLDYATVLYDEDGNIVWSSFYTHTVSSGRDQPRAVATNDAGQVAVTGNSQGETTSTDIATVLYDADGDELWVARYEGSGGATVQEAVDVVLDDLGNVFVTGFTDSGASDYDYVTIKYDSSGNELWTVLYDGSFSGEDKTVALALDDSGAVVVTGTARGVNFYNDIVTIKYDSCDGCLINDVCYANGDPNPANACEACIEATSTTSWSSNDGAFCDDGVFCNGADTCDSGSCELHAGDPCTGAGQICNEDGDICEDEETGIELISFTAIETQSAVLLSWETATEAGNAGYRLLRAGTRNGQYQTITTSLIPAEGGQFFGAEYQYTDTTVEAGQTYWYKLEDVDYSGVSTFHGPAQVTLSGGPEFGCGVVQGATGYDFAFVLLALGLAVMIRRKK